MGGFLLYGAWRTKKDAGNGIGYLAAAWGFTCGMGYASFFNQLTLLDQPDPAPISSGWVAVIKGVGFALAILALIASLKKLPESHSPENQSVEIASRRNAAGKATGA